MARSTRRLSGGDRAYRGGRIRTGVRGARPVWPDVLMAGERWQSRTPEAKVMPASADKPRVSCTIGERMWQERWGGYQ